MNDNASHTVTYRVYVEDTDVFGVLYHPRYLCFLERARTEWLRRENISLHTLNENGYWFAIASLKIDYLNSAYLDDELIVQTRISKKRGPVVFFEQSIQNGKDDRIVNALVKVVGLTKDKTLCNIDTLLSMGGAHD